MIKSVLSALAVSAALSCPLWANAADSASVTLYGVKNYSEQGAENGLYSVKAEPGAQPELYWADGDMMGNAGVVYTDDGTLYVLTSMDMFGQIFWSYLICDVKNKTYDYLLADDLDLDYVFDTTATMTYDPESDTIYAVCLADYTGKKFNLCTMDRRNAKKSVVVTLPQRLFTLSVTAKGQMYGVGEDGWLYKVNKFTGELTPVGDTGMIPTDNQYAVIDYDTNIMYWSAHTEEYNGALYSVDIETAQPTLISVYDDPFQLYGLYIVQTAHKGALPEAVSDLLPEFEGASLSGKVSFTLPTRDINGDKISGEIGYTVKSDDTVLATGKGQAGEKIEADVTVPAAGTTRFVVVTDNGSEDGLAANFEMWVGMDIPKGVTDLTVTVDGSTASATWNLPERGVHDGYVDHSLVRYKIVRGPEELLVKYDHEGTSFSETVVREGVYPVMYMVTPFIDNLVGESVIGNTALSGTHFDPPYTMDLTDPFMSLVFNIVDVNNDRATWEYSVEQMVMWCLWPFSDDRLRDDWLITPAFRLEPGFDYTLSLNMRSEGRWVLDDEDYEDVFAGELAAFMGSENTPAAMTKTLLPKETVMNHNWYLRESPVFTVDNEGLYYFGLHQTGGQETRNIYNTILKSIEVSKVPTGSGLESVVGDRLSVRVFDGGITIHNPSASEVRIVTMDGKTMATTDGIDSTVNLVRGLYIVVSDKTSSKVIIP